MAHDVKTTKNDQSAHPKSRLAAALSLACASCGCAIWVVTFLLLDPCKQGEQLARYFGALFNVMFLTAAGSVATTLLIVALVIARRTSSEHRSTLTTASKVVSFLGLFIGTTILIVCLPRYLAIMS